MGSSACTFEIVSTTKIANTPKYFFIRNPPIRPQRDNEAWILDDFPVQGATGMPRRPFTRNGAISAKLDFACDAIIRHFAARCRLSKESSKATGSNAEHR